MNNKDIPLFLPHGWKTDVAKLLGIHHNTLTNALKSGKGETYEKIKTVVIKKYGNPKK